MSLPLSGKVALVTGSSRGIGAAVAKRLASDGASVIVNYANNEAKANEVVKHITDEGKGKAVAIKANVEVLKEGIKLVEDAAAAFGRLDILVFNASYKKTGVLDEIDEGVFDAHFETNVKVPLFMIKNASKHLENGDPSCYCSKLIVRSSTRQVVA